VAFRTSARTPSATPREESLPMSDPRHFQPWLSAPQLERHRQLPERNHFRCPTLGAFSRWPRGCSRSLPPPTPEGDISVWFRGPLLDPAASMRPLERWLRRAIIQGGHLSTAWPAARTPLAQRSLGRPQPFGLEFRDPTPALSIRRHSRRMPDHQSRQASSPEGPSTRTA
jgi:hypothetical protein